jgi:hypothetical protein
MRLFVGLLLARHDFLQNFLSLAKNRVHHPKEVCRVLFVGRLDFEHSIAYRLYITESGSKSDSENATK